MNTISRERAMELLNYDPENGVFLWRGTRVGMRGATKLISEGSIAGTTNSGGYRIIRIDRINYRAHRLAYLCVYGEMPDIDIDHINGVKDDNRISNLRAVTRSVNLQNSRNAKSHNKGSGLLGAYKSGNRWHAKLQVDGKSISLGGYATAKEAHEAYVSRKRELHPGCTI